MRATRTAPLVAVAAIALVACTGGGDGDSAATDPTDAPAATEAPVVVPEALQFTAPLVGGGDIDAAALADKPTVFWFWAPT